MPVPAVDLLKKLMAKAGISHDITGDIPDDIATQLDNNLLTIAAATNNHPDVKKVYFAQAYNGLDAEIKSLVSEYGLSEDVVREIEAAGGSTKKAVALARKLKEMGDKTTPVDKTESAKHLATINELNTKLAAEIAKQADLKNSYEKDLKNVKVQTTLGGIISKYKTIYDEIPEAKDPAIQALINKALQDSDADFTFDEKGNLSLIKKDGTNLFGENHTLVTPQSFIDKTLSKILKVTPAATNGGTINTTPAATIAGAQNNKNTALEAAIAESLQTYETGVKSAVAI